MDKRAVTPEEKRIIIERLYTLWCKHDQLRLSQLIFKVLRGDFFYKEDEDFISELEKNYEEKDDATPTD